MIQLAEPARYNVVELELLTFVVTIMYAVILVL
jgi:hypothetical protein